MDQVIDDLMEEAKVYHRIYVASIHPDLSEEDIKRYVCYQCCSYLKNEFNNKVLNQFYLTVYSKHLVKSKLANWLQVQLQGNIEDMDLLSMNCHSRQRRPFHL